MKVECKLCGEEVELDECELNTTDEGWTISCPNGCVLFDGRWGDCPDIEGIKK